MNFLSKKLTEYILEKGIIEKYNYEIYQYGFQIFLELSLNILCSIIIAVILDMKIECIFFFLFFIPLRSYNGGLHMDRYLSCFLLSCTTLALTLLIVKHFTLDPIFSYLLYAISVFIIIITGPINHPNREVNSEENIRFKAKSNITLALGFIISITFLLLSNHRYLFLEALVYALVSSTLLIGRLKYVQKCKKEDETHNNI
ncbi:MAG: accessory gene regulator B family protein [Lachnospiraceae bacterium]|jgi:accessory gene regulator B|nr:accessory gene regulator B family protein [Lachnospiraceae bacterium]